MTMQDWKGQKHSWPKRLPSERRLHPRVRTGFPVNLALQGDGVAEDLPGAVADISIGGLRVNVPRFVEQGTEAGLAMTLAVTNRDGEQELHHFDAPVRIVQVAPETALADAEEYELSLQFTDHDLERERLIGVFMLQTLLFQPEAKLSL